MNFDLIFALLVAVAALGGFGLGWRSKDGKAKSQERLLRGAFKMEIDRLKSELRASNTVRLEYFAEKRKAENLLEKAQANLREQTVATESWAAKAKQHWITIQRVEGELEGCRKANAILNAHKPV